MTLHRHRLAVSAIGAVMAACVPLAGLPPIPATPTSSGAPKPAVAAELPAPMVSQPPTAPLWPQLGPDVLALVGRMQDLTQAAKPLYQTLSAAGRAATPTTPEGYTASQEYGQTVWSRSMAATAPGGVSGQTVVRFRKTSMGDSFTYSGAFIGPDGRQLTLRYTASWDIDYGSYAWLVDEILATGRSRRLEMRGRSSFHAQDDSLSGTITAGGQSLTIAETGPYGKPERTLTITGPRSLKAVATFTRDQAVTGLDVSEGGQQLGRMPIPAASEW